MALRPIPNKFERGKRKTRDTVKQILLLLIIQREGPIGRYRLKTLLEMVEREGVVRSMLEEYQATNIITSSRQGATLTPHGHDYLQQLLQHYRILDIQQLTIPLMSINPSTLGIHLQDCADQIVSAMDIRDIAECLRCSTSNIKTQICRSLRKLRKTLVPLWGKQ